MKRSRAWLVAPLVCGALWVACGEPLGHPYIGELYDPDADCLFPGTIIDPDLAGPGMDGGTPCKPICITDLQGNVYVSSQCPPYPTTFDLKGDDPACVRAFAATCRQCPFAEAGLEITCDAGAKDAGSEAGPPDGGPRDGAGVDAASDGEAGARDGGGG